MQNAILDDELYLDPANLDAQSIKKINLIKVDTNENIKNVKHGRTALIALAIMTVLGVIFGMYMNPYEASTAEIIGEGVVLIFLYSACAIGVHYRPRVALITGLVVYLLVLFLYVMADTANLYRGIIIKGVIIYYLYQAIRNATDLQRNLEKLRSMGVPAEELENARKLDDIPRTRQRPVAS